MKGDSVKAVTAAVNCSTIPSAFGRLSNQWPKEHKIIFELGEINEWRQAKCRREFAYRGKSTIISHVRFAGFR